MGGVHGLQMEYLESTWNPPGIQVDLDNNLAGLPAKTIPHGVHLESTIPCGFHVERPGIYGECKVLPLSRVLSEGGGVVVAVVDVLCGL
jgi:hypothetical protein